MANKLYQPILIHSIKAKTDIVQHRFIGLDGGYCSAGAKALGVSDVDIEKEQQLPVAVLGCLLIQAGGTIAVGDSVSSDENGKAIKTTDSAIVNGYALDSGSDGDEIRIIRGI